MKRNPFWLADDPTWAARRIGHADPSLADTVPVDQASIDALEQEVEQVGHERSANIEATKLCVGVVGAIALITLAAHGIARVLSWLAY